MSMSREANMEMERSRRQHEYEKKFGKDRETPTDPNHNDRFLGPGGSEKHRKAIADAIKEHELPYWAKDPS
jgi:hypothetical protein